MATFDDIVELIEENLATGSKIPAVKHREVELAILNYIQENLSQSGDIKAIKCNLEYLNANFDANGLGKNLRAGWAICNGNNGTDNLSGRTIIGQGLGYSTFGATGGNKDAVLVQHSHKTVSTVNPAGAFSLINKFLAAFRIAGGNTEYGLQGTATVPTAGETTTEGVSGTDRNMMPYIVYLYIQKL